MRIFFSAVCGPIERAIVCLLSSCLRTCTWDLILIYTEVYRAFVISHCTHELIHSGRFSIRLTFHVDKVSILTDISNQMHHQRRKRRYSIGNWENEIFRIFQINSQVHRGRITKHHINWFWWSKIPFNWTTESHFRSFLHRFTSLFCIFFFIRRSIDSLRSLRIVLTSNWLKTLNLHISPTRSSGGARAEKMNRGKVKRILRMKRSERAIWFSSFIFMNQDEIKERKEKKMQLKFSRFCSPFFSPFDILPARPRSLSLSRVVCAVFDLIKSIEQQLQFVSRTKMIYFPPARPLSVWKVWFEISSERNERAYMKMNGRARSVGNNFECSTLDLSSRWNAATHNRRR